jgi:hypothetical protein
MDHSDGIRAIMTNVDHDSTVNWVINMVGNRYNHIAINDKNASKRISVNRGWPQGGFYYHFYETWLSMISYNT